MTNWPLHPITQDSSCHGQHTMPRNPWSFPWPVPHNCVLHECVSAAVAESVRSGSVAAVSGIYYSDHCRVATDHSSWNSLTIPWHCYNFPWSNPSVFQSYNEFLILNSNQQEHGDVLQTIELSNIFCGCKLLWSSFPCLSQIWLQPDCFCCKNINICCLE